VVRCSRAPCSNFTDGSSQWEHPCDSVRTPRQPESTRPTRHHDSQHYKDLYRSKKQELLKRSHSSSAGDPARAAAAADVEAIVRRASLPALGGGLPPLAASLQPLRSASSSPTRKEEPSSSRKEAESLSASSSPRTREEDEEGGGKKEVSKLKPKKSSGLKREVVGEGENPLDLLKKPVLGKPPISSAVASGALPSLKHSTATMSLPMVSEKEGSQPSSGGSRLESDADSVGSLESNRSASDNRASKKTKKSQSNDKPARSARDEDDELERRRQEARASGSRDRPKSRIKVSQDESDAESFSDETGVESVSLAVADATKQVDTKRREQLKRELQDLERRRETLQTTVDTLQSDLEMLRSSEKDARGAVTSARGERRAVELELSAARAELDKAEAERDEAVEAAAAAKRDADSKKATLERSVAAAEVASQRSIEEAVSAQQRAEEESERALERAKEARERAENEHKRWKARQEEAEAEGQRSLSEAEERWRNRVAEAERAGERALRETEERWKVRIVEADEQGERDLKGTEERWRRRVQDEEERSTALVKRAMERAQADVAREQAASDRRVADVREMGERRLRDLEAQLQEQEGVLRDAERASSKGAIEELQAQLEEAERTIASLRQSAESNKALVSAQEQRHQSEVDSMRAASQAALAQAKTEATTLLASTKARLEEVEAELRQARASTGSADLLASTKARLEEVEAELRQARANPRTVDHAGSERELSALKERVRAAEAQVESWRARALAAEESAQTRLAEAQGKTESQQATIERLLGVVESVNREHASSQATIVSLRQQVHDLQERGATPPPVVSPPASPIHQAEKPTEALQGAAMLTRLLDERQRLERAQEWTASERRRISSTHERLQTKRGDWKRQAREALKAGDDSDSVSQRATLKDAKAELDRQTSDLNSRIALVKDVERWISERKALVRKLEEAASNVGVTVNPPLLDASLISLAPFTPSRKSSERKEALHKATASVRELEAHSERLAHKVAPKTQPPTATSDAEAALHAVLRVLPFLDPTLSLGTDSTGSETDTLELLEQVLEDHRPAHRRRGKQRVVPPPSLPPTSENHLPPPGYQMPPPHSMGMPPWPWVPPGVWPQPPGAYPVGNLGLFHTAMPTWYREPLSRPFEEQATNPRDRAVPKVSSKPRMPVSLEAFAERRQLLAAITEQRARAARALGHWAAAGLQRATEKPKATTLEARAAKLRARAELDAAAVAASAAERLPWGDTRHRHASLDDGRSEASESSGERLSDDGAPPGRLHRADLDMPKATPLP
jgi:hypothetical protein